MTYGTRLPQVAPQRGRYCRLWNLLQKIYPQVQDGRSQSFARAAQRKEGILKSCPAAWMLLSKRHLQTFHHQMQKNRTALRHSRTQPLFPLRLQGFSAPVQVPQVPPDAKPLSQVGGTGPGCSPCSFQLQQSAAQGVQVRS